MLVRSCLTGLAALAGLALAAPAVAQEESGKSLAEYEAACEAYDLNACHQAGRAYMLGDAADPPAEIDDARAIALFTKACDRDFAVSCNNLGILAERAEEGAPIRGDAIAYFTKGCDLGEEISCENLGIRYYEGRGVEKDVARAAQLFGKSCEAGRARPCFNAAVLHRSGQTGTVDLPIGALYLAKACDLEFAAGCTDLGIVYLRGDGMPKDTAQSAHHFEKGCELGHARGCYNLATLYDEGTGVERSSAMSIKLYARSCKEGYEDGCAVIEGTKANCVNAYREFALEGEFNSESRKVLRFYAVLTEDGTELFESGRLGIDVQLNEFVSGTRDFDASDRLEDVKPGIAQIVVWPGQPAHYMEASDELATDEAALEFLDHMCGLVGEGVLVETVKSEIFTTIYSTTLD